MNTPVSGSVVVIDASVWISNIWSHDANHTSAQNWIEQHLNSGGLLISPVILAVEIAATVARVTQNPVAAGYALSQLRSLSQLRLLPLDQTLVDDATNIAMNFGLRGADSFYVAVAQQLAIPLVTFDQEQLTRPASIIATIRP